jgi:hypothetical protein
MKLSLKRLFRTNKPYKNLLVLNSFSSKFPKATEILWQQIDSSKCQVNFTMKKKRCTALFNSKGIWLETVTLMPINKIPKQLQLTLEEKNHSDGLQKLYHIQNSDRNFYEVSLNNGLYKFKLLFNLSGKIIGKVLL